MIWISILITKTSFTCASTAGGRSVCPRTNGRAWICFCGNRSHSYAQWLKMCGKIYKVAVSLLCSLFCLCAAVMFASCESPKVKRINAEQVTDLSGYWNDTDVRLVANTLIKECTEAPAIAAYIRANGKMPVVIVGTFRNQSDEHIDTSKCSKRRI